MKEICIGNVGSREQAEKIRSALDGATYMNLRVEYGIMANNYPVTVSTDCGTSTKEFKSMVIFQLAMAL